MEPGCSKFYLWQYRLWRFKVIQLKCSKGFFDIFLIEIRASLQSGTIFVDVVCTKNLPRISHRDMFLTNMLFQNQILKSKIFESLPVPFLENSKVSFELIHS